MTAVEDSKRIIDQWREANDWPGLVWSAQNLSDEPRWLAAYVDLESRIATALTSKEQQVWREAAEVVKGFDDWVSCECSECRADARSHAIIESASLAKLVAELESAAKKAGGKP